MPASSVRPDPRRSSDLGDGPSWPRTCAEAAAVVFWLRRNGLPALPGVTTDAWASSILAWSTGRVVRCVGLDEVAA